MLTSYGRFMKEPRMPRQEFVVCCVFCGEVVALKMGGERVPEALHFCKEDVEKQEGGDAETSRLG